MNDLLSLTVSGFKGGERVESITRSSHCAEQSARQRSGNPSAISGCAGLFALLELALATGRGRG